MPPPQVEQLRQTHLAYLHRGSNPIDSGFLGALSGIARETRDQLITEHHYDSGTVVIKEGEVGEALYIIRSGWLAVIKGELTAPVILGYRGPGEIVGEMALIEDRPSSASVVALEDIPRSASVVAVQGVKLLRLSRENFTQLLAANPNAGLSLLKTMSARLRESDNARRTDAVIEQQLSGQVNDLQAEKQHLIEQRRLQQSTINFVLHDLRNPISALIGALELLKMVLPQKEVDNNQEILNIADSAAVRLMRLVNTTLEVARMEVNETMLARMNVSLPLLCTEVANQIPALFKHQLTFKLDVPEHLPPVYADRELVERVLTNLLDNAIKYTPQGGCVTIRAKTQDTMVAVAVVDQGSGIPHEQREQIFGYFSQANDEKMQRRGYGLGLTFCRLAVEAHGGKIFVEDGDNGTGTQFVFTLPIASAVV